MGDTIGEDEPVLLLGPEGERQVVRARSTTERVPGLGVVALGQLRGRRWGETLRIGLKDFVLTPPILADHLRLLERKSQIITPKDASRIVLEAGLRAGSRVLEAGVGSGGLTTVLAHSVAPGGCVYALDLRSDHLEVGRRNVTNAGLDAAVEFRIADVRQGVPERGLDAIVLDMPDPEAAVKAVHVSLRPGGALVLYTPNVDQMAAAVRACREEGLRDVRSFELIERAWVVHDRGARPDFEMLGHTGFITTARKV